MKTLGTIPHAGVHARVPRQKILLLSMALTCGGLPTQRSFRLAALSFLLSFWCLVQLGFLYRFCPEEREMVHTLFVEQGLFFRRPRRHSLLLPL